MYTGDMSRAEAHDWEADLERRLADPEKLSANEREQLPWDLEDVREVLR